MSKEKSPAYQQYPSDYLSDFKVQAMTLEEEGMYVRLMQYCWKEISLPDDQEILTSLCKGKSPTALVLSCFYKVASSQCDSQSDNSAIAVGELRHKRLDKERQNQANNRQRKSLAGQKGNEKRWGKPKKQNKIIATGSQGDSSAIAKASQNVALQSSSSICNLQSSTKRERAARIAPDDFALSDQDKRWATETRPDLNIELETEKFRNYEFKNTHSDWRKTWKNWILNARASANGRGKSAQMDILDIRLAEAEAEEALSGKR